LKAETEAGKASVSLAKIIDMGHLVAHVYPKKAYPSLRTEK
jgi:hypothetical protein